MSPFPDTPESGADTLLAPALVRAGEGRTVSALGDGIQFKLGAADTGGALAVGLATVPPGGGPPPHVHAAEDELFLMLEGRVQVYLDGAWSEAGPGDLVFLPRGVPHGYRNAGDAVARFWVLATPGGFDSFFERFAQACGRPGGPDMAEAVAVAASYGITFVGPAE